MCYSARTTAFSLIQLTSAMQPITNKLRRTRLFAHVPEPGLVDLVEHPGIATGDVPDQVPANPGDLVVLLEGGLHMLANDGAGDHLAILGVDGATDEPAILYTIPRGAVVRLTRKSVYLVIDGARLDTVISQAHEQRSLASLKDSVRERVAALILAAPFKQLTFDQVVRCAEAMQSWDFRAGEDVVEEGEPGDFFYVLESGTADVMRGKASTLLAKLRSGASFGEEALLHGTARNATVRMTADGRLLRLDKIDFDRLLKPGLVAELEPDEVRQRLARNAIDIIDCRTEEEWELWRLPGARLIPLETLRERARGLAADRDYLVYCRTGRRSVAATFLLRQMGIKASALKGGLVGWPYAFEGLPMA